MGQPPLKVNGAGISVAAELKHIILQGRHGRRAGQMHGFCRCGWPGYCIYAVIPNGKMLETVIVISLNLLVDFIYQL